MEKAALLFLGLAAFVVLVVGVIALSQRLKRRTRSTEPQPGERNVFKCTSAGCDERALFHLAWVRDRRCVSEEHLCDQHARQVVTSYHAQHRVGQGGTRLLQGDKRFEIELVVISERHREQGIYLREMGGLRLILILTGIFEATSLTWELQGKRWARPLTHRAMASAIRILGGQLEHVLVDKLEDNIYHSKLAVRQGDGLLTIDIRPSDAFVMAIILDRPIFVASEVVAKAPRVPRWDEANSRWVEDEQ